MNIFEFAIKMEMDGERYYKEQAELNNNNGLKHVFLMLAKDEENHYKILQKKFDGKSYDLKENNTLSEFKSIFNDIKDFKIEIREIPNQLDLYRNAMDKEKHSIEIYKKMQNEATDDSTKDLCDYLIKQEQEHFAILEDMVLLINRTRDWVESAEFGIREDY